MILRYARGRVIGKDTGILSSIVVSIVFIISLFLTPLLSPNSLLANDVALPVPQKQIKKTPLKSSELEIIKKRGTLRIIVPTILSNNGIFPQRIFSPLDDQQKLAMEFARSLGVKPELVPVNSYDEMLPTLNNNHGDIIVANMAINEENKKDMVFSVPVDESQEVVLVRKEATEIEITKDLAGKSLVINGIPDHIKRAKDFILRYPSINLIKYGDGLFDEQVLDMIVDGQFDATIADHNIAKRYLDYRDDIRIAFNASAKKMRAWGLRLNSIELKTELDKFLIQNRLSNLHAIKKLRDLTEIRKQGVLRVLLKNNTSSYFWKRNKFMGFEYELAKAIAKDLDLKISIIVPPDDESALHWLEEGKADVAAGFLAPELEWKQRGIDSSLPYHQTFQHIVVPESHKVIHSVSDLAGKTVVVQKNGRYWKYLKEIIQTGINIDLQPAPEGMQPEEIIRKVASGEYESTLVDGQILAIEKANQVKVKSAFTVGDQISHSLAVRGENTKLLSMLNRYIRLEKDGPLYTRLYNKYFSKNRLITKAPQTKSKKQTSFKEKVSSSKKIKTISLYDHLIQKYSRKNSLDWRFISAQMFQESRFNPNAVSFAGATGLMQIMPSTGKILGVSELKNPEISIKAGTKYMGSLFKKFEEDLPVEDRMWFTLASYNAGIGHVMDARLLARKEGLNPNRWFGNVEKAMLLLSESKYFKKARYGYVRGREPVKYVRLIKNLYENYTNIAHLDEIAPLPLVIKTAIQAKKNPEYKFVDFSENFNKEILSNIETEFQQKLDFDTITNEIASLEQDLSKYYAVE